MITSKRTHFEGIRDQLRRRDLAGQAYHAHLQLLNGQEVAGPADLPNSPAGSLRVTDADGRVLDVPAEAIESFWVEDLP